MNKLENYLKHSELICEINYRIEKCLKLDLSKNNSSINNLLNSGPKEFEIYLTNKLKLNESKLAAGGYREKRSIYDSSDVFNGSEKRNIHLGIDLWMKPGIKILAPLDGIIHSFKDNNREGDYGPAIILQHEIDDIIFYSLYGHLSRNSLTGLENGKHVKKGEEIARLGNFPENGNWAPHLHFQIILDLEGKEGDYPGVCAESDKEKYFANCPDPNLILQIPGLSA